MRDPKADFISALKWPALAAVLVAGALSLWPMFNSAAPVQPPQHAQPVAEAPSRAEMRDAMRILRDGHDKVLDQIDRRRAESEQKAAEDAHAFEQARIAAAQEAARKLAEQKLAEQRAAEQRAAEARRVTDTSSAREAARKPKPEPVVAGVPLDIVPPAGESPPVHKPRGPLETVVATVGDVADEIKNKTVSTVVGIKDWFSAAGDKLLGRDKPASSAPASQLSSTF